MSDLEIVKLCKNGNAGAQRALYERYASKMLGVCLRYLPNRLEAEDALQDSFIKVFDKLDRYKATGCLEGWIRTIVVRTALEILRKNDCLRFSMEITDISFQNMLDNTIESDLYSKDLLKLIQKLPHGYRTVFNLYVIEGYSHKEIAEILSISEGTSKSQFSRAKKLLKSLIRKEQVA